MASRDTQADAEQLAADVRANHPAADIRITIRSGYWDVVRVLSCTRCGAEVQTSAYGDRAAHCRDCRQAEQAEADTRYAERAEEARSRIEQSELHDKYQQNR